MHKFGPGVTVLADVVVMNMIVGIISLYQQPDRVSFSSTPIVMNMVLVSLNRGRGLSDTDRDPTNMKRNDQFSSGKQLLDMEIKPEKVEENVEVPNSFTLSRTYLLNVKTRNTAVKPGVLATLSIIDEEMTGEMAQQHPWYTHDGQQVAAGG